jgi:hypothetical protein
VFIPRIRLGSGKRRADNNKVWLVSIILAKEHGR